MAVYELLVRWDGVLHFEGHREAARVPNVGEELRVGDDIVVVMEIAPGAANRPCRRAPGRRNPTKAGRAHRRAIK